MLRNKKVLWLLVIAMVSTVVMTACGSGEKDRDTLVIANGADAPTLDPHAENDNVSAQITGQIFNRLVRFNTDMEVEPDIATDWEQLDDLTWEFKIRKDVKFHNGDTLTVDDVKYSIERHLDSPSVSHTLEAVDKVEVIDDETVHIITKKPFAALLAHLNHSSVTMLSEKATEEAGEDFGQEPVGTGPYQFDSWSAGDKVVIKRFDDYFGEAPAIEKIEFRNIPEGTNRTINLETGEVDLVLDVDPNDKDRIIEDENLVYVEEAGFGIDYMGFNLKKEPFNDVRVRKAINYAIDKQEIIDVVMKGSAEIPNAPLQKDAFGANTELEAYPYDPEKAMELLAEAGYPDGFTTSVATNDNDTRVRMAEIIQGQLKKVNIDLDVDIMEWGAYLDRTGAGEHEMFILGWTNSTGDAENGLSSRYLTQNHGDAGNRMFYTNEEVDRLIMEAGAEQNPEKRVELYKEAQKIILDEAPDVLLKSNMYTFAMQKYVKGFKPHPSGSNDFSTIYFEFDDE